MSDAAPQTLVGKLFGLEGRRGDSFDEIIMNDPSPRATSVLSVLEPAANQKEKASIANLVFLRGLNLEGEEKETSQRLFRRTITNMEPATRVGFAGEFQALVNTVFEILPPQDSDGKKTRAAAAPFIAIAEELTGQKVVVPVARGAVGSPHAGQNPGGVTPPK